MEEVGLPGQHTVLGPPPQLALFLVGAAGQTTAADAKQAEQASPPACLVWPWRAAVALPRGSPALAAGDLLSRLAGNCLPTDGPAAGHGEPHTLSAAAQPLSYSGTAGFGLAWLRREPTAHWPRRLDCRLSSGAGSPGPRSASQGQELTAAAPECLGGADGPFTRQSSVTC